jgi:hypothetical protein
LLAPQSGARSPVPLESSDWQDDLAPFRLTMLTTALLNC